MNKPTMQLSSKVQDIPEALSIYMNQLCYEQKRKGKDVTILSLGEAFFDIPVFDMTKLDFSKGYHYSDSQGVPELREIISKYYKKEYGATVDDKNEILITAGSKPVIYFAMQATLNEGDEILIHEPAWLSYQEQAKLVGAKPAFIPFDVTVDEFHKYFNEKTKMLVINNPNNPAGRVYTKEELESIYIQCRSKGIYVLVDEAYSDFVLDEKFHSMTTVVPDKDGVITVNSLSKNMGMSGWRVGYVITTPILIKEILKLNQHVITCAPTILQYYMAQYFDEVTAITLPQVREVVEKRERVAKVIDEIGLKRMKGNSTFYFMINIENFPGSSLDFAMKLLMEKQISVVPGLAYGDSCERFVRVGIGTESEERIKDALLVINDMINIESFDKTAIHSMLESEGFHSFKGAM